MTHDTLRGLYAIADAQLAEQTPGKLIDKVSDAIAGGVTMVQYRDKINDPKHREQQARELLSLCRQHGIPFIINDDVALAIAIGADGVHLGQGDIPIEDARKLLGTERIIGISCHNQLKLALTAEQAGANYVAFGRFFPSQTKPDAPQAEIEILHSARNKLTIPVVAIGGITPDNAQQLVDAGVDMIAVINGLFGQADIKLAAQQLSFFFSAKTPRTQRV